MPDYDLVIVGAGCAGLALGRALSELPRGRVPRALLIDGRTHYTNDRTWSFWAEPDSEWHGHARASWSSWRMGRKGSGPFVQQARRMPYLCVRAIDYYRAQLKHVEAHPRLGVQLETRVRSVERRDRRFVVETDQGRVSARHVVDTRAPAHVQPMLWQQFSGFEVRTAQACFDPGSAGLMLDMDCDEHGFIFTYLLPFAPDEALVEATRFSRVRLPPEQLRMDAQHSVQRQTNGVESETVREEAGCLPMGYWPSTSAEAGRPVRAGAGAGALRSASGYGFLRMQAWARQCAGAMMRTGVPIPHPAEPRWRKAMDRRFLQVLSDQPYLAPILFESMARRMKGSRFASFMSDAAGPVDIAAMISALPKSPFLLPAAVRRDHYAPAGA